MNKKIIFASMFGNAIEFYEFTIYAVFAAGIAQNFFPNDNQFVSLLLSFLTFALGFFARPIGGMFFGFLGDKYGRKKALSLSIGGLGVITFLMACLPTYNDIGLISPILLALLRVLQGVCLGGEGASAAIFALEHSIKNKRALVTSTVLASGILGLFLAMLISFVFSTQNIEPIVAWRYAMLIGVAGSLVGLYIRAVLPETPEFEGIKNHNITLKDLVSPPVAHILFTILLGGLTASLAYTFMAFSKVFYAKFMSYSDVEANFLAMTGTIAYVIGLPIFGYIADTYKVDRFTNLSLMACLILIIPIFALSETKDFYMAASGMLLMGTLCAALCAPSYAFVGNLFEVKNRCFCVATYFNVGVAIFGGTIPMVNLYIVHNYNHFWISGFYIGVLCLGTLAFERVISNQKAKSYQTPF